MPIFEQSVTWQAGAHVSLRLWKRASVSETISASNQERIGNKIMKIE